MCWVTGTLNTQPSRPIISTLITWPGASDPAEVNGLNINILKGAKSTQDENNIWDGVGGSHSPVQLSLLQN